MDRWCEVRALARGAVIPVEQCWQLALRWYRGRLDLDWTRPSLGEMEEVFAKVGLGGPFWSLR
ncbi:MAG: hypothetical protein ACRELV_01740 [Longimicrobiales bacterium]